MYLMVSRLLVIVPFLSGVQCSIKKGLGVGPKDFLCNDFQAFDNMPWWYDWAANFDNIESKSGCTISGEHINSYVPMIWGYNSAWKPRIFEVDHANKFLLGFNEPNHVKQSNLTPQQAVDAWPLVEQIAREKNLELVSPAAARCGGDDCNYNLETDWFNEFFRLLCVNETVNGEQPKTCRVDYLATHIYTCKETKVKNKLQALYDEFKLKIWLTEFACPESTSADEQLSFMQKVLPILEKEDHVYRYAWFVHRSAAGDAAFVTSAISLLEPGSSTRTPLGDYYNSFTYGTTTTTSTTTTPTTTTSTTTTPATTTSTTTTSTTSTTSSTTSTTSTTTSTTSSTSGTTSTTASSTTSSVTPTSPTTGSTASTTTKTTTTESSNARRNISVYNDVVYCIMSLCVLVFNCIL